MDRKFVFGGIGALVLLLAVSGAFAMRSGLVGASEADLIEQEAASIAEDHVSGTAQNVELEQEMGGPVYEVTVETANGDLQEVEADGERRRSI